ncbi:O-antigen ligase family protein [Vampirovibrio sp.]|uniref:O-antigen ligase family protein n=1 Tax=Vampirovibrio sp. TaxID=2717857 RepID=UPI00359322DD
MSRFIEGFKAPAFPVSGKAMAIGLAVLGLVLPLLIYLVLPVLGVSGLADALGYKRLILLAGAGIGAIVYWQYWRFVIPRPQVLLGFVLLAWPVVAFLNAMLLELGINLRLTPLLLLTLMLPMLWVSAKNYALIFSQLPWLKYYLIFFSWLTLYFIFYNAHATDPQLSGGDNALSDGAVSTVQLISYLYCLLSITVSAVAILKARNFRGLFDFLNQALLWVSGLEALFTIIGFPFKLTSLMLDGFDRAIGIFSHPNPFAHHMGIVMIYLLGLYCYYQGERKQRMPAWLIWGSIGFNFLAFMLGLSKTALGTFALCALTLFLMNLAVPAVRRGFAKILIGLVVVLPLGLLAFQLLSGKNFFGMLDSRMNETESFDWRTMIWEDLMSQIHWGSVWLGHGFTAANQMVFNLTFNDAKNANPLMMVHNAYIALLYDLGLMGYFMFVAAISLALQSLRGWMSAIRPALRTEHSIIIALTLYFLLVCGFDEMSYMFDAPQLYWLLVSLLFCMTVRERRALPA